MKVLLKTLLAIALGFLAASCASHGRRVDCDSHLKPINAPAPAKHPGEPS